MKAKLKVDDKKFNRRFKKAFKDIGDKRKLFLKLGLEAITNFVKNIDEAKTPEGNKWADWGKGINPQGKDSRYYITKKGTKKWRRRPSGKLYTTKSKLMQDKGARGIKGSGIKSSFDFVLPRGRRINYNQKFITVGTVGSSRSYAKSQFIMRKVIGTSLKMKNNFKKILDLTKKEVINKNKD